MNVLQRGQMGLHIKTAAHSAVMRAGARPVSVPVLGRTAAVVSLVPEAVAPRRRAQRVHATMLENREASSTPSFMSLMEEGEDYEEDEDLPERIEVEADESLKVANLGLCPETVRALSARGIEALFAIQKAVFQPAAAGRDMIGRAKTGSGKTLAFALPVVESLLEENRQSPPMRGRSPRCIILAPTRELANQVAREFKTVCPNLVVESFYGGVSAGPQMRVLQTGCDVVVGTPGRIMDLIDRRALKLDQVRFAILDEADQMLDMGFADDMEHILKFVPVERQTLLFSATLPSWVNKVAKKYLKNPLLVDLVGEANTGKLADTIRLMVLQVDHSQKVKSLLDLLSTYTTGGGAIVFVNTKRMADELQSRIRESVPCEALHGDIAQNQREQALKDFRAGKFSVLVATDVAARGLDIPNVDVVIHYDLPQDNEAFLHRSGRTGRAGNTGTAVVMYGERDARTLAQLFRETKVSTVELVGSPDPADVMTSASRTVLTKLDKVDAQVIEFFVPAAERLLASEQPSRVLAAALASMSGFRNVPRPRSLLTYEEGHVTLRLAAGPGQVDGWLSLSRTLGTLLKKAGIQLNLEQQIGKVKMLGLNADGRDCTAFDLPIASASQLLSCAPLAETMGMVLDRPKALQVNAQDLLGGGHSRGPPRADSARGYGRKRGGYGRDSGYGGGGYGRDSGYGSRGSSSSERGNSTGFAGRSGGSGYGSSGYGSSGYGGGSGGSRAAESWGAVRNSSSWGSAPAAPARSADMGRTRASQ